MTHANLISPDGTVSGQTKCHSCGGPVPPVIGKGKPRIYCSPGCWPSKKADYRAPGRQRRQASRRPLPEFAKRVGWDLRKDVERLERILADDRFTAHRQLVAAHLRGHLEYAAEVCQDLLSRLDKTGE